MATLSWHFTKFSKLIQKFEKSATEHLLVSLNRIHSNQILMMMPSIITHSVFEGSESVFESF